MGLSSQININMRRSIFLAFTAYLLTFINILNAQVSGKAFLNGQSDHSGIKVLFIKNSPTAVTDSTYTLSDGSYSLNISGGVYFVQFSKVGYQDFIYNNSTALALSNSSVLNDVTLLSGSAVLVSGNQSGFWAKNNTYYVTGNITVPYSDTLVIEAGTIIKFNGYYVITTNGVLLALGTQSEPILFTSGNAVPQPKDWDHIDLKNSGSILDHCKLEYGDYGVYFENASPLIQNCFFQKMKMGGVYCNTCSPNIFNCDFDSCQYWGIWVVGSSPALIECNHVQNGTNYGILARGNTIVRDNEINDIKYIGIDIGGSNNIIENNFIHHNQGGITIGSTVTPIPKGLIINNTIINNTNVGIIFRDYYADGWVVNNIICNNGTGIEQVDPGCKPTCSTKPTEVSYNIVSNNLNGNFLYIEIAGLGQLVTTNVNGDSVDGYFNIVSDPLLINNYSPQYAAGSPAINSGKPQYSANIGFDTVFSCQTMPVSINKVSKVTEVIKVFPNPFQNTLNISGVDLNDKKVDLIDFVGRKVDVNFSNNQVLCKENLPPGLYYLLIRDNTGALTYSTKLIKN